MPRTPGVLKYPMASRSSVPPAPEQLTSSDFPVLVAGRHPVGRQRHVRPPQQRGLLPAVRHRDQRLDQHQHRTRPDGHARAGHRRRVRLSVLLRTAFPAKPGRRARRDPAGTQQRHLPARGVPGRTTAGKQCQAEPITALGHWVHVYVDRTSRKPVPIPDTIRSLLSTACVDDLAPGRDLARRCAFAHPVMLRQCRF